MSAAEAITNGSAAVLTVEEKTALVQQFIMHHVTDAPLGTEGLLGSISRHQGMLVITAVLLIAALGLGYRRKGDVPHGFANLLETFVQFIRDQIAVAYLGEEDGRRMTPLLCSFFFFILTSNLLGLIPFFYTSTANLGVTAPLAVISFGFMVFGAIYKNGVVGFFKGFVPHGVPWPIAAFLLPIELIGLVIKSAALAIRLFANMLAGHMVIFFLVGMVAIFGYAALPATVMAVGIYILEVFIAFLQAYIFTLLSALFIGQTYHPAH